MTASAQYMAPPPEGWGVPKGFTKKEQKRKIKTSSHLQLTANEAVKTRRFWMLWLMLFINITCQESLY